MEAWLAEKGDLTLRGIACSEIELRPKVIEQLPALKILSKICHKLRLNDKEESQQKSIKQLSMLEDKEKRAKNQKKD